MFLVNIDENMHVTIKNPKHKEDRKIIVSGMTNLPGKYNISMYLHLFLYIEAYN